MRFLKGHEHNMKYSAMRKSVLKFSFLSFVLTLLAGCVITGYVIVKDKQIKVEIADTGVKRALGLMNRTELNGGMLFVFKTAAKRQFWMKDTLIPLDIIWIDNNSKVVGISKGEPLNRTLIPSPEPVKYVLELNYGVAKELGLEVGDDITINIPS